MASSRSSRSGRTLEPAPGRGGGATLPRPRRAEVYFALSEAYKEPAPELAAAVADGSLAQAVAAACPQEAASLRLAGTAEQVLADLRRAYYPLFVIPPRFVLPVESTFKEWGGEDGFLAGERGLIMGPPAADMLRRYRERGLEVDASMKDYPDHLCLLLEYGGLLCAAGEEEELREFVAAHLDGWVEELAAQVARLTAHPFYLGLARATVAFVRGERVRLDVPEPNHQEVTSDA